MGIIRWQFAVIISLLLQGAGIYATNVISTGGSSFAAPLYKQLMTSYNSLPKWDNSSVLSYRSSNRGTGRTMLLNKTYIFAGTDNGWTVPQTSQSMRDNVMMIPSVAGAVVVVYNLPQLRDLPYFLNLSREATADIFLGRIVTWNDAVLQALNPSVQLPNETIRVVVRRDQSGTTDKFTSALSKFSQDFASQIGRSSLPKWNKQDYNVSGNGGVARAVAGFEYAIGYVDIAVSKENDVQYATMINKRGKYVRGSYESLEATLRNLPQSEVTSVGNITEDVDLADLDGDVSYPLAGLTYYVLNRTVDPENCDTMRHAARYLHWKYTSSIAVDIAHTYEFAVISGPILERTIQLLQTVQCETATNPKIALWGQSVCDTGCKNGKCRFTYGFQPPSELCSCDLGYKNQKSNDCSEEILPTTMEMTDPGVAVIVVLSSALLCLTVAVIAFVVYHRRHKIIKAASPLFCVLSLLGVLLAYVDVFLYVGRPNDAICILRPTIVSLASAIFFGTVLPKTFRIYRVFRRIRALKSSISDQRLLMQSGFIVAGNLLLLIIWFAVSAPKAVLTRGIDESKYICAADNSTMDTVMVNILLFYHGLLIAATTFLAFKVRVAKDVFNEAIPLGLSVYGVTTVAIFFVPVGFITSINLQTTFLLRTSASIVCATTVLVVLFVPKIMAILRPAIAPRPDISSTAPGSNVNSKKPIAQSQVNSTGQTSSQAEFYSCEFYCKKNGLFTSWNLIKLNMFLIPDVPGTGVLIFHDVSDLSVIIHTFRVQDVKLVINEKLRSTGLSRSNPSSSNNDTGSNPSKQNSTGPNFGRLMFADGYYDLEGKSTQSMATLMKAFSGNTSVRDSAVINPSRLNYPQPDPAQSSISNPVRSYFK